MPVKPDSRYARQPLRKVVAPDNSVRQVLSLRLERAPAAATQISHRLRHGETIDLLAKRYLGDERLWWWILDINPAVHPLDLKPGDVLAIPEAGPATRATRARRF